MKKFVWKDSLMWEGARDMFVIVLEKNGLSITIYYVLYL